jgi:hypothetical protein
MFVLVYRESYKCYYLYEYLISDKIIDSLDENKQVKTIESPNKDKPFDLMEEYFASKTLQ